MLFTEIIGVYYDKCVKTVKRHCEKNIELLIETALRGPRKWIREMAIPRYPNYPASRNIAGQLCTQGYKYGNLVLQVGGWAWC
jgi:hypothetical protein